MTAEVKKGGKVIPMFKRNDGNIPSGAYSGEGGMLKHPGPLTRLLFKLFFSRIQMNGDSVRAIKKAADEGYQLIYVMKTASIIDYLVFNNIFLRHNIPLAEESNIVRPWILRGFTYAARTCYRRLRTFLERGSEGLKRDDEKRLFAAADSGLPVFYFLRRGGGNLAPPQKEGDAFLAHIVELQRQGKKTAIVPLLILWGKEAGRRKIGLYDLLFGDTESPGRLRKLFIFLGNFLWVRAAATGIMDLGKIVDECCRDSSALDTSRKVKRLISLSITSEKKLRVGPKTRPIEKTIELILKDRELQAFINRLAKKRKVDKEVLEKKVRAYIKNMAALYNPYHTAFLNRIFKFIWNRLYDRRRFDPKELDRVREIVKQHAVVLVPCHRSHIDYLLISSIFFENDMMPPLIAAGENLAFWPVGYLFRRAGAFFIRRKLGADLLYAKTLHAYIKRMLKDGHSMEVFIEGGRSRTGRTAPPKLGLLAMQIDAYLSGACEDIYYIPVSLSYDRVVEDEAFSRELGGAEKEKESLKQLLNLNGVFSARYGKGHVRFGEPVSLNKDLALSPEKSISAKEKRDKLRMLGRLLIERINEKTTVTSTGLVAAMMLDMPPRTWTMEDLKKTSKTPLEWLKRNNAILSSSLRINPERALERGLKFLKSAKIVREIKDGEITTYHVEPSERVRASYYRNSIAYHFAPLSLAAFSALLRNTDSYKREDEEVLLKILKHEGALSENFEPLLENAFSWMEEKGWISKDKENIHLIKTRPLTAYAALTMYFLEPYFTLCNVLENINKPFKDKKHAVQKLLKTGKRMEIEGRLLFPESNITASYDSALTFLFEEEIVQSEEVIKNSQLKIAGKGGKEELNEFRSVLERLMRIRKFLRNY